VRWVVAVLLFLTLVDEGDPTTVYSKHTFAPFSWVDELLFAPTPIRIRLFDMILLVVLFIASSKAAGKGPRVAPMRSMLLLVVVTVALGFIHGIATGGDARAASWQIYLYLSAVLTAFVVAATFRKAEDFIFLGKALLAAGLYRALRCCMFYFAYVRTQSILPVPEYTAAHDDTVVWVICIMMMIALALDKRTRSAVLVSLSTIVFLLLAIQWNRRRLAWVSLAMALAVGYFLIPLGARRRRVVRIVQIAVPVVALYTFIGWGRPEKMFLPLRSFASVSVEEDASTKARNCENLGLIATVRSAGVFASTGWGHPYIELTSKYSIAQYFDLWPYVPHNGILGVLAYTGILGFVGYWLAFPTAVFLNARIARMGNTQSMRNVGLVGTTTMMICANQMYGDMGTWSFRTTYLLAMTYGMALRLPPVAGVWDPPKTKREKRVS
jgi:hypothetical protein